MKKILLLNFMLCSVYISGQQNNFYQHEIKANLAYIYENIPEFGYEFLLDEETGIGLDAQFAAKDTEERTFALTGYFRKYMGQFLASGFFAEGFAMYNKFKHHKHFHELPDPNDPHDDTIRFEEEADLALGVAVGLKYTFGYQFFGEVHYGGGFNLFGENKEYLTRAGISVGLRF